METGWGSIPWSFGTRFDRKNSELLFYYTRIEILGICLFSQSVLANLHANTYYSDNIDQHSNNNDDDSDNATDDKMMIVIIS